jgi:hypothetical protein
MTSGPRLSVTASREGRRWADDTQCASWARLRCWAATVHVNQGKQKEGRRQTLAVGLG